MSTLPATPVTDARLSEAEALLARAPQEALALATLHLHALHAASRRRARLIAGEAQLALGAHSEARALLEALLDQGPSRGVHAVRLHAALGQLDESDHDLRGALRHFERAEAAARREPNRRQHADLLMQLGRVQHRLDHSREGLAHLRLALEAYSTLGDASKSVKALINAASIHSDLEEFDRAQELFGEALHITSTGQVPPDAEVVVRGNLGRLLTQLGRHGDALIQYGAALDLAPAGGEHRAVLLLNSGEARRCLGETPHARRDLEEALHLARALGLARVAANVMHSLGLLHLDAGDHARAEAMLTESARTAVQIGDLDIELDATLGLGRNLLAMGDKAPALKLLLAARERAHRGERRSREVEALELLARITREDKPRAALLYTEAAYAIERQLRSDSTEQRVRQLTSHHNFQAMQRENANLQALAQAREEAFIEVKAQVEQQLTLIERGRLYDDLTGLPNRMLLRDRLEQAIESARRDGREVLVGVLDIHRFGRVNETFGQNVGDALLRDVAARVGGALRDGDTVARIGGDEFMLLLSGLRSDESLEALATRLLDLVQRPYHLDGQEVMVRVSLGFARFPEHAADAADVQRAADLAVKQAKLSEAGFEVYRREGHPRHDTMTVETALYGALERGEFEVHYQPLMGAHGGGAVGAEALLRWHNPTLGRRGPAEFIPVLERTGLIVPVGAWVLERACLDAARWGGVRVAVNFSARQFAQPDLRATVESALRRSGLPSDCLEVEITESMMMRNQTRARTIMQGLRDMGVRVMLDDFGTGYSSLSQLLEDLPLTGIKIDRSFINKLDSGHGRAVLAAIVKMCEAMRLEVVAEGVETETQRATLADLGVGVLQGYLFGRPLAGWTPAQLPGWPGPLPGQAAGQA